jgi:hypothetical protein
MDRWLIFVPRDNVAPWLDRGSAVVAPADSMAPKARHLHRLRHWVDHHPTYCASLPSAPTL